MLRQNLQHFWNAQQTILVAPQINLGAVSLQGALHVELSSPNLLMASLLSRCALRTSLKRDPVGTPLYSSSGLENIEIRVV